MFIKFVLYSKTNKTTAIVLPLQLTSPYIYIYSISTWEIPRAKKVQQQF